MTFRLAACILALAALPASAQESGFLEENFAFRRELLGLAAFSDRAKPASRASAGFEAQKKFSSETKTWGAVDVQGRLVRRAGPDPAWDLEYHNAYADFYSVAGDVGRVNVRAGRFYVPFGLNTQTDTHGTLLQLSNEEDLGFERDWYAGVYGALDRDLDYGAYYLAGSGYDLKWKGQSGLTAARLQLGGRFASEYGLEGGLSCLGGQRLVESRGVVDTARFGADARLRRPLPHGTGAWTTELGGGRDDSRDVFMQLHQADWLHASRRWGLAAQYRRRQEAGAVAASAAVEATWYFRNDVGNADLHWVKLNLERQTERAAGRLATVLTLQYYRYW